MYRLYCAWMASYTFAVSSTWRMEARVDGGIEYDAEEDKANDHGIV